MDSTPTPKATGPDEALIARADERLAHAYEQISRADEKLARLSEQLTKMERDAATSSAEPGPPSSPSSPAFRAFFGFALAACIIAAALFSQSSYGARAKLSLARWIPQLASNASPPSQPSPPAQPAPTTVQIAAADAALPQTAPLAAPQDAPAPPAAAGPDQAQLLQTMAHDLADLQRSIDQLKSSQQQMASDNAKAVEQLKSSQDEIKRVLAKVSEPNLPKPVPPPTQPTSTLRKLERTVQAPRPRLRPRSSRDYYYDDGW
jgi:uncharacterized coiled-coil protein SlyX